MLFSEPKIPQPAAPAPAIAAAAVSVLFSEPKIPQSRNRVTERLFETVSVLFSEPKIPQSEIRFRSEELIFGFSALQRAENSSTERIQISGLFDPRFSALQRAENSSILARQYGFEGTVPFQCSSASRKFLKPQTPSCLATIVGFSALQRAENSSTQRHRFDLARQRGFSALQRAENSSTSQRCASSSGSDAFQCSSASRKFLNFRSPASRNS